MRHFGRPFTLAALLLVPAIAGPALAEDVKLRSAAQDMDKVEKDLPNLKQGDGKRYTSLNQILNAAAGKIKTSPSAGKPEHDAAARRLKLLQLQVAAIHEGKPPPTELTPEQDPVKAPPAPPAPPAGPTPPAPPGGAAGPTAGAPGEKPLSHAQQKALERMEDACKRARALIAQNPPEAFLEGKSGAYSVEDILKKAEAEVTSGRAPADHPRALAAKEDFAKVRAEMAAKAKEAPAPKPAEPKPEKPSGKPLSRAEEMAIHRMEDEIRMAREVLEKNPPSAFREGEAGAKGVENHLQRSESEVTNKRVPPGHPSIAKAQEEIAKVREAVKAKVAEGMTLAPGAKELTADVAAWRKSLDTALKDNLQGFQNPEADRHVLQLRTNLEGLEKRLPGAGNPEHPDAKEAAAALAEARKAWDAAIAGAAGAGDRHKEGLAILKGVVARFDFQEPDLAPGFPGGSNQDPSRYDEEAHRSWIASLKAFEKGLADAIAETEKAVALLKDADGEVRRIRSPRDSMATDAFQYATWLKTKPREMLLAAVDDHKGALGRFVDLGKGTEDPSKITDGYLRMSGWISGKIGYMRSGAMCARSIAVIVKEFEGGDPAPHLADAAALDAKIEQYQAKIAASLTAVTLDKEIDDPKLAGLRKHAEEALKFSRASRDNPEKDEIYRWVVSARLTTNEYIDRSNLGRWIPCKIDLFDITCIVKDPDGKYFIVTKEIKYNHRGWENWTLQAWHVARSARNYPIPKENIDK